MPSPSGLLLLPFLLLVLYAYRSRRKGNVYSLPCPPKASWLWGHELEAFKGASGEFYTSWIEKYGSTFRMKGALGHSDILVLADPLGLAHVFHNVYNYPHSATFRPLIERLIGRSLVWVEGETAHRRMRRLINPAFTMESVKLMTPAIYDSAVKLQDRLAKELHHGKNPQTVNILDFCSGATLDIIGRVGFGHDFGQGESLDARRILKSWREQVTLGLERSGFIAMMVLRLFPFITSLPVAAFQAQGEIKTIIKQLGTTMIERNHGELDEGKDLLSILMRANHDDNDPISKDELLDHISTFVLAGHETTSGSLSFTIWELARNPQKQSRLREEVLSFVGDPSYEDFQTKLPYLDACCKEGLRLHPPSAHTERVADKRDTIPLYFPITKADGTKVTQVVVEKDQLIYVPSISVNRLSSVWGDGEVFRPERWLEPDTGVSSVKIKGWNNIFTFSDGPRHCIGYRLAVFEWKVLMMSLIRQFVFHDTGAPIISRFSSTLQPRVLGRESEGIQIPVMVTAVSS